MLHSLFQKPTPKRWRFPCWAQSLMVLTTGSLSTDIRPGHGDMRSACFRMWITIADEIERYLRARNSQPAAAPPRHSAHLECEGGRPRLYRHRLALLLAATAEEMRNPHSERSAATDPRSSAQLRGECAHALVSGRGRRRSRSCLCWPPIWDTAQPCPRTTIFTSSSRSERRPANGSPNTTAR